MAKYACVPVLNAEEGKVSLLLPRGAAIPDSWPQEVRKSLEESGAAVSLEEAIDIIEASHAPALDNAESADYLRQLLVNDHGRRKGEEYAGELTARWLAELEVAIANGLAPAPERDEKTVDVDVHVKVKKPKARA